MERAGVIIEKALRWTVSERRGSVLLKGVREKILEIFEKSIDKHKIDAILIRRPDSSGSLFGRCRGRTKAGGFRRRIRRTIPIQGFR